MGTNRNLSGNALDNWNDTLGWVQNIKTISLSITVEFDVKCFENKSDLTDQKIADLVYKHVKHEREMLVMEARIKALDILDGEGLNGTRYI